MFRFPFMLGVGKAFVTALLVAPPGDRRAVGQPPKAKPAAETKFDGLGKHSRKVATKNADAQAYFDQGMAFLFAFNHDEAVRSFERAAALDPECAMAHWGVAVANGGHINKPVIEPERAKKAVAAVKHATEKAATASDTDRALIAALALAVHRPAAERPRGIGQGILGRDESRLGEVPERRRCRGTVRRVADEPAAVGSVDRRGAARTVPTGRRSNRA